MSSLNSLRTGGNVLTNVNPPLVLIVDDEEAARLFAARALTAAGWRALTAADLPTGTALADQGPSLILLDLDLGDGVDGRDALAALRRRPKGGAAPVLAYTARLIDSARAIAAGFDGLIGKPCTTAELAEAASPWWPDGAGPALGRLEERFGAEQIGAMLDRLRALLVEAVTALDAGDARSLAHRLAGIAGMLGFEAAGRAWLAIAEGEGTPAQDDARRQARRAIATIDRRTASVTSAQPGRPRSADGDAIADLE